MNLTKEIKVSLDFGNKVEPVGRMAIRKHIIYFEFDTAFIKKKNTDFSISPAVTKWCHEFTIPTF